ncbi:hypothetical protein SDC9_199469 [bioreactor metagenome]|uniref:Uncharacterized protein n=1 Tax=bioreactor metagenome TaxID=1076179 RepID=A0A645IL47_9ZZZZ
MRDSKKVIISGSFPSDAHRMSMIQNYTNGLRGMKQILLADIKVCLSVERG